LLYGKFETKEGQLNSIKIHLPLFGPYMQIQEKLGQLLQKLQNEGMFLQSSRNETQGKISFQITSNDWEILQTFAEWYKKIENFSQITKKEYVRQMTETLKTSIQQGAFENQAEILKLIEEKVVKILVKS
jgi:hypothetical protein